MSGKVYLTASEARKIRRGMAAQQTIIDKQAAEIERLTAQRDALYKNNADLCEVVKKRSWISVADELPPTDGEPFVVLDGQNSMFVAHFFASDIRTFDTRSQRLAPELLIGWTKLPIPDYEKLLPQPPEGV